MAMSAPRLFYPPELRAHMCVSNWQTGTKGIITEDDTRGVQVHWADGEMEYLTNNALESATLHIGCNFCPCLEMLREIRPRRIP